MTERTAQELVKTLYEAMNARDLDALDDLFAPDFLDHQDGQHGVEALKAQLRSFLGAFSDLHVDVEEVLSAGDRFACRTTVSGTHDGELMGLAPSGTAISVSAIDIVRMHHGRAVERWGGLDMFSLLVQLGVIPQPQSA